ncbi:MAG: DNA methyltransferase [Thermodesulfobacteriota bacterium]|nr:DNA methyltransferase [Thermodesulfobacteriota bacterium]
MFLVRTIGYDQHEMIGDIISLHCPGGIEADITYSKGNFYKKGIWPPKYKMDIQPQIPGVISADSRNIPLLSNSINTLMYDPPFVGGSRKKGKPGIIKTRFGYFKSIPELWAYYKETLVECYRVLRKGGTLIFKCQDTVESGKQYFTHNQIMNDAVKIGFYPKDLFILLAKSRLISNNMRNQQHARKYHCYFWVFKKEKCR